jgi:hypothetical protein
LKIRGHNKQFEADTPFEFEGGFLFDRPVFFLYSNPPKLRPRLDEGANKAKETRRRTVAGKAKQMHFYMEGEKPDAQT